VELLSFALHSVGFPVFGVFFSIPTPTPKLQWIACVKLALINGITTIRSSVLNSSVNFLDFVEVPTLCVEVLNYSAIALNNEFLSAATRVALRIL